MAGYTDVLVLNCLPGFVPSPAIIWAVLPPILAPFNYQLVNVKTTYYQIYIYLKRPAVTADALLSIQLIITALVVVGAIVLSWTWIAIPEGEQTKREVTRSELIKQLQEAGYTPEQIERILEQVEQYKPGPFDAIQNIILMLIVGFGALMIFDYFSKSRILERVTEKATR